jgi:CheY-like chemotaxis protein
MSLDHQQSEKISPTPHVLIVEDNKLNQLLLLKLLQKKGARVHTADDGLLGVTACQEHSFDLILMDLSMPTMDGFDATREILSNCPLNQNTPIIAVSANFGKDAVSRCLEVGMLEFVAKPLRMAGLEVLFEKYLHKQA